MDDIRHHGILGMKWGVRRYQNKDGTLTSSGKRRYKTKPWATTGPINPGNIPKPSYGTSGPINPGPTRGSKLFPVVYANKTKTQKDSEVQKMKDVVNRGALSTQQLQKKIERLRMEKELRELTEKEIYPGKAAAMKALEKAGTIAITGAALYTAKALITKEFNAKELGSAVFNGGPKKK